MYSDLTFSLKNKNLYMQLVNALVFLPGESMDRGAWWATVYGVAESAMIEATEHTHNAPANPAFPEQRSHFKVYLSEALSCISLWLSPRRIPVTRKQRQGWTSFIKTTCLTPMNAD